MRTAAIFRGEPVVSPVLTMALSEVAKVLEAAMDGTLRGVAARSEAADAI